MAGRRCPDLLPLGQHDKSNSTPSIHRNASPPHACRKTLRTTSCRQSAYDCYSGGGHGAAVDEGHAAASGAHCASAPGDVCVCGCLGAGEHERQRQEDRDRGNDRDRSRDSEREGAREKRRARERVCMVDRHALGLPLLIYRANLPHGPS